MAGGGSNWRELDQTPTWAVASVCGIIIFISILLEKALEYVGKWFTKRRKKALVEALEKVKGELMVLGFISLLLTFGQNYISKICIPQKAANTMLPCSLQETTEEEEGNDRRRRLLWDAIVRVNSTRRVLATGSTSSSCDQGKVPLVSLNGLHQLHIFVFFLAIFHVAYSALTMALGRAKIRRWKEWEQETFSPVYEFSNDPSRFRFSYDTTFVKQHTSFWTRVRVLFYVVSFFRQFFRSVRQADYLAMRHGFISAHLAPGSKFNFRKYIKRSLEDDFKVVVGISPLLWGSAVVFLLLNVSGRQTMFWVSLIPLTIILAVGTKLQAIITQMAIEIQEKHAVIQGVPVVKLSDQHFWFGRPHLVLFLIHFSLFQNAFHLIYFFWIWYEFGLRSCFHDNFKLVIARVCIGVGVQFLCSYSTLPLYALVSQMGSHMKRSIFNEQTSKAIMKWHEAVKKKQQHSRFPSATASPSPRSSPNRLRSFGCMDKSHSRTISYSDQEVSDVETDTQSVKSTSILIPSFRRSDLETGITDQQMHVVPQNIDEHDFSFAKPEREPEHNTQ